MALQDTAQLPRLRYIPFRKHDIVEMLLQENVVAGSDHKEQFLKICQLIESIFHFEFHAVLETLKNAYFPLDPDQPKVYSRTFDLDNAKQTLFSVLQTVLNNANFEEISPQEIRNAFEKEALLGLRIMVDLDDFEDVKFFYRGARRDKITQSSWFGFKKQESEHTILERVVMLVKFKPKAYFENKKIADISFQPGSILMKLFKDVPKEDLEILFPNAKIRMTLKNILLLAVPALLGGIPLLLTKIVPALLIIYLVLTAYMGLTPNVQESQLKQSIVAISAAIALGGFLMTQWTKYQKMRYEFQKELSDNLYFRNLVNNVGVFHSLIDSAEEEECKESFLAYYFLKNSHQEMTEEQLDQRIEKWFVTQTQCEVDFECSDALSKLFKLKLINKRSDGVLIACDYPEALRILDERWDNFFQYNNSTA